jgi:ureidoacrylate peracid hydrolase
VVHERLVDLDSRPTPTSIDVSRTAVIVVDMQNDFGSPGGMFARAGVDVSGIQAVVAPTAAVLAAARDASLLVVYLKMEYDADLTKAGKDSAPNWLSHLFFGGIGTPTTSPDGIEGRILVRDTWNTAIVDALAPVNGDLIVSKHRYSGFFQTELHARLQERGIRQLVFTGCTTSVCVESTLRDAYFRDYSCVLLEDCCAEPIGAGLSRSNHDASLLLVEVIFGRVSDSDSFIRALAGARVPARR